MSRFNVTLHTHSVVRLGRVYHIGPIAIIIAKPLRDSRIRIAR